MAQSPSFRPRANRQHSLSLPNGDAVINPRHPLSAGLAFFFVPSANGFNDLIRGDVMTLAGTVSQQRTPYGPAWLFGSTAGGVSGSASTVGGDAYYQPTSAAMSLACGCWNPAAIATPTDAYMAQWVDGTVNGLILEMRTVAGTPRMALDVTVGGVTAQALASGGAGITMATSGQGMTYVGTYDGTTASAYYSSTSLPFNSGTAAKSGTPANMGRVLFSNASTTTPANRVIMWAAGWFRTLTLAEAQFASLFNGSIPPGLLIQRAPRTYSYSTPPDTPGGSRTQQLLIMTRNEDDDLVKLAPRASPPASYGNLRPPMVRLIAHIEDDLPAFRRRASSGGSHGGLRPPIVRLLTHIEDELPVVRRRVPAQQSIISGVQPFRRLALHIDENSPLWVPRPHGSPPAIIITMRPSSLRYICDDGEDQAWQVARVRSHEGFARYSGVSTLFKVKADSERCPVARDKGFHVGPDVPVARR